MNFGRKNCCGVIGIVSSSVGAFTAPISSANTLEDADAAELGTQLPCPPVASPSLCTAIPFANTVGEAPTAGSPHDVVSLVTSMRLSLVQSM